MRLREAHAGDTFGFSRPYGSSSLGLNTLRRAQSELGRGGRANAQKHRHSRYDLHPAVDLCAGEVRARRALGDHLGMDALGYGVLDAQHDIACMACLSGRGSRPKKGGDWDVRGELCLRHGGLVVQRLHLGGDMS